MSNIFNLKHFTAFLIIMILIPGSIICAQEVYLRLTDYGGGKIDIVVLPFSTQDSSKQLFTRIKNIEEIIKNDLEYSLYFDILPDTTLLSNTEAQTVLLEGNSSAKSLNIMVRDFSSKKVINAKTYEINGLRETAHKISDDIITALTGEPGIAQTKIVFSCKTSQGKQLALIDYDGFNFTWLTRGNNYYLFPAWALDCQRVLFSTYAEDRLNIYLYNLSNKKISLVSSFRGLNFAPCWSPDGSRICLSLTKDGNAEIYILELGSKKLRRLTHNQAIDTSPTFSPNSREIAFVSDRTGNPQIYIMDIYGSNVRRLTYHGNYNTSPAWSPRGDVIAYVSREKDNSQQIYITDPNDYNPVRLTQDGNNEEPSWSPDGLHIVFTSNRTGQYELYTMNWDGSRQRKLTSGIIANAPDWSPFRK